MPVGFLRRGGKDVASNVTQEARAELRVLIERAHQLGTLVIGHRVEDAQTAEAGHLEVEKDEVWALALVKLDAARAIRCAVDDPAALFEEAAQEVENFGVVIDQQYGPRHSVSL